MFGGVVAVHPATDIDARIARLANFMVGPEFDVCVLRAPDRIPDAALNRLDEASSVRVFWGPYQRRIFAERQNRRHSGSKTAGNDRRDVRAFHGNSVGGRTMDFTAFVRGALGAVVTAFLSFVVHRRLVNMTVPMVAGVLNRVLDTEAQPCIAMQ